MITFSSNIYRTLHDKERGKQPGTHSQHNDVLFRELNQKGFGIFHSPQTYAGPSNKKTDLSKINTLFADLDVAKQVDNVPQAIIDDRKGVLKERLLALPTPPSAIVNTRNGLQPYWYLNSLDATPENIARCENTIKSISLHWAPQHGSLGDDVHDIVHLLRVPGYYHNKSEPYMVTVVHDTNRTYTLEELERVFPALTVIAPKPVSVPKTERVLTPLEEAVQALDVREVVIRVWEMKGNNAHFDGDNHLVIDGVQTATFANRDGGNFIATSSAEFPAKGNAITYVAETLGISNAEAFAWIVKQFRLGDATRSGSITLAELTPELDHLLEAVPASTEKQLLPVQLSPILELLARNLSLADAQSYVRYSIMSKYKLSEADLRPLNSHLRDLHKQHQPSVKGRVKPTLADEAVTIVEHSDIRFFNDEKREPYVRFFVNDHYEIHGVKSKAFREYVSHSFYLKTGGDAISDTQLDTSLNTLAAKCRFEGETHALHLRLAWHDGALWYDLCNEQWQAVRIDEAGYEVVNEPPVLFRRYLHMQPQVMPSGQVPLERVFEIINITDEAMRLLLLCDIVSMFIPGFPHPCPIFYGEKGTAKTSATAFIKRLVDPSVMRTMNLPHSTEQLLQNIAHNRLSTFDNVSPTDFSTAISDAMCSVISGTGAAKRALYTDDDDFVYTMQHSIVINGINIAASKPDFLDRSILMELSRIPEGSRRTEREMEALIKELLPGLLGTIFTTISKAMRYKEEVHFEELPRMADFAEWGGAIALALGKSSSDFLTAYRSNIDQQSNEAIADNLVASLVLDLMERSEDHEWHGTPNELLTALGTDESGDSARLPRTQGFPKSANRLSTVLREYTKTLSDVGCNVWQTGKSRKTWHISKMKPLTVSQPSLLTTTSESGTTIDTTAIETPVFPDTTTAANVGSCDPCDVSREFPDDADSLLTDDETRLTEHEDYF